MIRADTSSGLRPR